MNKWLFLTVIGIFLFCLPAKSQFEVTNLSLSDVISIARSQSPASRQAETRKKNRYWQYRLFKSNYNPQLALTGNLPGYDRDYFSNRLDDGSIDFQQRQQLNSSLSLGLNQPIALTGGNISINSGINYFTDLQSDLTQFSTTTVNIRLDQPLFAYNQLKWDKFIEPLRYEESKRSYVEELEFVSREAVEYYFNYLNAQINYQIAKSNLSSNDTIYKIESGRYNIGTTSKDKLLQVELQLLRSKQDVVQAQLDLQTSSQKLQAYLGITIGDTLILTLPTAIPEFTISMQNALMYAKMNRADYIAFERRRIEADAAVAKARKSRFQTNVSAAFGLNSASNQFDQAYLNPNQQQRFNIGLTIPILDWGRSKARMQTALANQELANYVIAQDLQNFVQEVKSLVRQFAVLRNQLVISKKSDEVAQERFKVSENRYLTGKVDITNLNIALNEKDAAKRSYLNALRDFWVAYYDLRRLTLYDFSTNTLLYTPLE